MTITIDTFIEDFKNSGIIDWIGNYLDIIFVWVTGSRSVNLNNADSDYDVGILVADHMEAPRAPGCLMCGKYLKDPEKHVHLLINTLKEPCSIPVKDPYGFYYDIGWVQFGLFDKSSTVFVNPKYQEIVDELITNKSLIAKKAAHAFLNRFDPVLEVLATNKIPEGVHQKFIAYAILCHSLLYDEAIVHDQLYRVKQTPFDQLTTEERSEIARKAAALRQLIKTENPPELCFKSFEPWWEN